MNNFPIVFIFKKKKTLMKRFCFISNHRNGATIDPLDKHPASLYFCLVCMNGYKIRTFNGKWCVMYHFSLVLSFPKHSHTKVCPFFQSTFKEHSIHHQNFSIYPIFFLLFLLLLNATHVLFASEHSSCVC